MPVMIVGGAGYIGSVTAELLLSDGFDVLVYDNLSTGHREALLPEVSFVEGDLADRPKLLEVLERYRPEAVMHFAACSLVGESMLDPARYFANNVANCINLLGAMLEKGVRTFVFSSTAAVYGEPTSTPITEEAPSRPTNPYGESKLMVEKILDWYQRQLGVRYAALRYFNAAGASALLGEDHVTETHLIPLVLDVALGRRAGVEVYGTDWDTPDGTCVRDYIHVVDLARAHILALRYLEENAALVCNLGIGTGHSVAEVIETARDVTRKHITAVPSARRPGDPAVLVASAEKASRLLGWQARHSDLHTIVRTAWEWRQAHPHGYGVR